MKKLTSVILIIATVISMLSLSNLVSYSAAKDDSAYDCVAYAKARFREVWGFDLHATGSAGANGYYFNASTFGDTVSSTPKAGALAVWDSTVNIYGHVAFVESVNGSSVTYSEGGYDGHFNQETRDMPNMSKSTQPFLGYVYVNGTGLGATVIPNTPTINISKYVVQENESFTVSFNAEYAERYWIGFYLDNSLMYDTSTIGHEVSVSLPNQGKYSVVVSAINSIGETVGYSSVVVGDATDYLPMNPTISVNKSILDLNETLIVNFTSKNVEEYWIGFYLNGILIKDATPEGEQYQISFDKLGKYSLVVTAINRFGETYSNLRFTVGKYDVVYHSNGGESVVSSQIKAYETDLTLTSIPTREGYIFLGWSTDSAAIEPEYLPGDTYTENESVTLYAVWEESVDAVTVQGLLKTFGNSEDEITIEFVKSGETEAAYSTTVAGDSEEFSVDGIEAGEYTLKVSKANHVAREYDVTIGTEDSNIDLQINLMGDINSDGRVNTVDVARANANAKGVAALSGYELACADINGDGKVNTLDVARMNAHAKGMSMLW